MTAPIRTLRLHPLRALAHRAYLTVWIGALVSNIGTWMETIAVGVHVTETTGKAGWTGTVAALVYVPALVLGPIGGTLADRFERRGWLTFMGVVQTVLAGSLAVLAYTGQLSLPAISVLMLLTGCAATLAGPAFSALLASIVPAEDLLSAMTLSSAQYNLARIGGPALAAAVIAAGGLVWAFGLNALSFVAVVVAVRLLPLFPPTPGQKPEPLWEGIREGFEQVRRDAGIRGALLLTLATAFFISPFIGLVPVMAIKIFGRGAAETSLLVTCQGVGAVTSAVVSTALADAFGRRRLVERAAWLIGPVAAIYWLSPTFGFAMPAMSLLGALYLSVATGANTVCLSRAPRALQARVSSFYSVVLGIGYAAGVMIQGWLGDLYGVRQVAVAACAIYMGILLTLRVRQSHLFAAMDEPVPPSAGEVSLSPSPARPEL